MKSFRGLPLPWDKNTKCLIEKCVLKKVSWIEAQHNCTLALIDKQYTSFTASTLAQTMDGCIQNLN